MRGIRLLPAFLTVGGWTLASRLFGFLRDVLIAGTLGSSAVAEAFLVAFTLPNMFRRFFAEGAFNMAFVPMFSKKLEAGKDAEEFASDALSGLAMILILLTLVAQLFMPWMVMLLASGFAGDERFGLAVGYGVVVFPYILFISLAALLSGVLNAAGRFALAAAAPVFLNLILISAILMSRRYGWDTGWALSWSVPVAGIVQLALVWWGAEKIGLRIRPRLPQITPDLKRLAIIAAPAALAGGVVQVNLVVGRQVASYFDGAVAWLNYADRLYQLPLGVVGIAVGVVLLPDLSRRLQADDVPGSRWAANRAAEFSLALTLPAAVALVVVATPLVSTLYERGAFSADDTVKTAIAVAIYGVGLPAFVLQKVLSPLYFAREDTKHPFYFALVAMLVNVVLAVGLAPVIGYTAAAVGTSLAGWINTGLLWWNARGMGDAARIDDELRRRAPRLALASLLMGGLLLAVARLLAPWLADAVLRYPALLILVAAGMAGYAAFAIALGGLDRAALATALRRRKG
ncbi:murein biosynthesis integral membrane protein MurJ [Oceanomicrobium pacificus]|uniref:Probable lipid II flippase MurJ n=1 Tax=Oceanomicrobium pacificus TaxID=2692916 RepID=A0A6B0TPD0_9RHOB|nr:murein biosynthesis integral membrane protein MurJ [Oceanomicrobium pacificus]MXU64479.1 murein biosynthesis integral membrane protein MurJ [Oceanomicrobium pacificus]